LRNATPPGRLCRRPRAAYRGSVQGDASQRFIGRLTLFRCKNSRTGDVAPASATGPYRQLVRVAPVIDSRLQGKTPKAKWSEASIEQSGKIQDMRPTARSCAPKQALGSPRSVAQYAKSACAGRGLPDQALLELPSCRRGFPGDCAPFRRFKPAYPMLTAPRQGHLAAVPAADAAARLPPSTRRCW